GATLAACTEELSALVGPGFAVEPPSGRGQQFEAMLASYSMMVSISSIFALFIGMFIIYNSFSIAVSERRSEIGVLRAIGASRGQIQRLFLAEAVVLGVVGSFLGMLFGIAIARGIAYGIGAVISDIYRVEPTIDQIAMSPALLALAFVIGVAASLVGAALP